MGVVDDWVGASRSSYLGKHRFAGRAIANWYDESLLREICVYWFEIGSSQQLMSIEEELYETLYENYRKVGKETGYWGRYFLRELKRKGAVPTLKRMLKPAKSDDIAAGFQALIDAGRTQLSIEATALHERFRDLFTEDELSEARRRLELLPDYVHPTKADPEDLDPSEIPDDFEYTEGSIRRITINAFERDRSARAACIKKYGTRCAVCRMSFSERYGAIGKGFIHVHHKKPLAIRRSEYELRPTIDLVPVCPNCHAMLHSSSPPLSVQDLQDIYEERNKA